MDTLDFILNRFNVDPEVAKEQNIKLPIGRNKDMPKLYNALGFKVGAEIGTYEGAYASKMFRYIPGLKLYCIDLWEDYDGYDDFKPYLDIVLPEKYELTKKNLEGLNAEIIRGSSADPEILAKIPDESLDFVYIDGNHAYEWAVWDIANWEKKVRIGGIVAGHDYEDWTNKHRWYQINVKRAVDGWLGSYKIAPLFLTSNNHTTSWFYVKTRNSHRDS